MTKSNVKIIFNKTSGNDLAQYENNQARLLVEKYSQTLHTKSPIKNIELDIDHQKNTAGHTTSYRVTLIVCLLSGQVFITKEESRIAKAKGIGLGTAIHEAFREIERQYEKTKRA